MSVEFKNYYDVLGVAPNASDAEIKNAFRSLARKYHPDVAKDKAGAENRFKEINEANEVLSDPDKRRRYDELGANWNHPDRQTEQGAGGFRGGPEGGSEFHFSGTGFSDFFEQFFGSRGRPSGGFGRAWDNGVGGDTIAQRGQDIEGDILVTLDEVMRGSVRTIRLQRTDPHTGQSTVQTLRVRIPPGVREAQLIRLTGKDRRVLAVVTRAICICAWRLPSTRNSVCVAPTSTTIWSYPRGKRFLAPPFRFRPLMGWRP